MLHFLDTALDPIRLQRMLSLRPVLLYAVLLIGLPLGILLAIFLATFAVMVPVSLLMGWI